MTDFICRFSRASLSFTPEPNPRGASGGMEGRASAEAGRVVAAVAAMLLDTADADVQRSLCRALMNLSTGDAACLQAIAHAGGVAAVVAAMRQHAEDAVLQRFGCCALMNLSCGDGACEQAVVDGGGVAAVAAAMGQRPTDAILQICGSSALETLAINAVCEQVIVDGGGVSALLAAMSQHPEPEAKIAAGALEILAGGTLQILAGPHAPTPHAAAVLEEVARTETDCSSWDGLQEVLHECALARLQTAEEGADVAALEHAITMAAAVQVDAAALEHARERVREMHADAERQVELESYGLGSLGPPKEFLCPITLQKMRGVPPPPSPPSYHSRTPASWFPFPFMFLFVRHRPGGGVRRALVRALRHPLGAPRRQRLKPAHTRPASGDCLRKLCPEVAHTNPRGGHAACGVQGSGERY